MPLPAAKGMTATHDGQPGRATKVTVGTNP
jgi:hypothetical protein